MTSSFFMNLFYQITITNIIIYNLALMEKNNGRLIGLLGTLIIHLIVGILIMSFQIRALHIKTTQIIEMELLSEWERNESDESEREEMKLPERSITTIERALQGDEELLNIARNLESRVEQNISRDDYIDMVKNELINSGQLGSDNYIDQQRALAYSRGSGSNNNGVNVSLNNRAARNEEAKPMESDIAANYKGPTRIYYSLGGRTHTYLPDRKSVV